MAKKALDKRILERRQKDLSAWEVRYQRRLDERVADYSKDLQTAFVNAYNQIEERSEKLFDKMVRLDSLGLEGPANTVRRELNRLSDLGGNIRRDLEALEGKLQPYYTQAIANEYTRSYYEHGFGLSQSAKVAANVPLLTESHILGAISNPWVGDGANYSTRLRRNVQNLADNMKEIIKQATIEGLGWNKAAQLIQEATGESYNAAVTLFRTEMNRASSLAASYSYMKNADVLDSKRWNATLDKDTAPRDAANDGETFDLDYDTPGNEGIPGKRIPNHPNCRCKYSPVLSALGVANKGRIARFEGERTYTKAGTYREWADEVGLPSLDERLERDNLKSYLRPGESVADLNKRVVRRKHPAGDITVPRAPWDNPKTKIPKTSKEIAKDVAEELGPDPIKKAFEPAKTIKEANAWAKANLNVDHVDYKGFNIEIANDVNKTFKDLQTKFPEVTDTKWITTSQARNKALYDRQLDDTVERLKKMGYDDTQALKYAKSRVKRKKVTGSYASSTGSSWGPQEGVCFNQKWAKDPEAFKKSLEGGVASGWGPKGTGTPGAVVTHEFGHQLDYFLESKGQRKWVDDMFREFKQDVANYSVRTGEKFAKGQGEILSQYANTNSKEFFAEAFAEYLHSDNPRPTAVKVFKRLEEALEVIRSSN